MKVDAVILAGGDGAVLDPACRFKGLVSIYGRPMVEWVVDAARAAEDIEDLAVVVPTAEDLGPWVDKVDKLVVSDGKMTDNTLAGVTAFREDRHVLVTTGDLPLLTGDALDDFIVSSLKTDASFTYPLLRKEDILEQFPGTERTFIKLRDASITGGNMMVLDPALVRQNMPLAQGLFQARKSPVGMASLVGMGFLAKLVSGRLRVSEVEAKASELLGGTCVAVFTSYGSIGMDVDKPADVVLVEDVLARR